MKKKIFVNIILILELLMFAVYFVSYKVTGRFDNIVPINYVIQAGAWCHDKLHYLADLIRLKDLSVMLLGYNLNFVTLLITLVAVNLAWIIVFYLIFGIIGAIIKSSQLKKRRAVIPPYKLTPTEEKRFSPQNYKKRSGRWAIWTLIVPLIAIGTFIFARFDIANIRYFLDRCVVNNVYGMEIYWKLIRPIYNTLLAPINADEYIKFLLSNQYNVGYFDLMYRAYHCKALSWLPDWSWPILEYGFLAVATAVILFVWWGIFKLIALIFRGCEAKARCNKAKKAYIEKMEKLEYKLRRKYKDDAVAKGDEFLRIIEEELSEDAEEIAKIKEEKSKRHQKKIDAKKKAYLEEIGYGVVDLGLSEEQEKEVKEPIVEREIRYISDADVDIILDEEPVIEMVEEDDMEEIELANKEDDLFFEKYQEDDVDLELVEENKPDPKDVMDYVQEKAEEKEEPVVLEEEKEEPIIVEEYQEEVEEEKPVEEPVVEEVSEVSEEKPAEEEKVVEEAPKKVDPFAAYRGRVNRGHSAKKVQSFKEAGFKEDEMMVRDDGVKVSIKYDPFAKWRNQERKKGYGAKKVPTFKELQAQREAEEKAKKEAAAAKREARRLKEEDGEKRVPSFKEMNASKQASPAPKKNDPFAAYRNKPKASTAAKKVAPKAKVEPKKAEVTPAPAPKKNDPFAAYRNKPRGKGYGAKKVVSKGK